jgi:hypothetical protein
MLRANLIILGAIALLVTLGSHATVFGQVPPPPPDAGSLPENAAEGKKLSFRERLEKHRTKPECASCHQKMDPLGFGLENFNAIGAWRTQDGKFPVDASGALPDGRTFQTPVQLKALLKEDREVFVRGLAEKLLIYALGRGLQPYDRKTVDEIGRKLAGQGYPFQSVIYEVVRSFPFQSRRGEAVTAQNTTQTKEKANR